MICQHGWLGSLLLAALLASCQPYEDIHQAVDDPEEASYAIGTLNGNVWEASTQLEGTINVALLTRKGKVALSIYGIQEYNSDLYWDVLSISDASWIGSMFHANLNKEQSPDKFVAYNVIEYDVSVARYELDKTQENYLRMSPMWGTADYTGELEVHLIKVRSADYAPPTPDTLNLVVDVFRATRIK